MIRIGFALIFLFAQGLCFAETVVLLASKTAFIKGITDDEKNANENGVFPVLLEWNIDGEDIECVEILRRKCIDCSLSNGENSGEFKGLETVAVLKDNGKQEALETLAAFRTSNDTSAPSRDWKNISIIENADAAAPYEKIATIFGGERRFIDKNENAAPCEIYCYMVNAIVHGKSIPSNKAIGYGALTANAYMDTYNSTVISSHDKLTLMHKKVNLQKLGRERALGDLGGDVSYRATVRGLYGIVYIEYSVYSDNPLWIITGGTNTRANIFANGKMFGTVECHGIYPGKIHYDNLLIKKGNAAGGYYVVEEEGFEKVNVDWDEIDEELIANEELEKEE